MMGTSAEFYFQPPGTGPRQADYLIAEDVITPGGIRSMSDPASFGDPDHYTQRFQGADDNGGVHTNSAIPNQVFYLAIEGGTNRTSGLSVQGVGGANRDQIEKVFYRAFTQMLPSNATFTRGADGDHPVGARPVRRRQSGGDRRHPGLDRPGRQLRTSADDHPSHALPTLVLLLASAAVAGAQTTKPTHPAPAVKAKPPVNTRTWPELVFIDVGGGYHFNTFDLSETHTSRTSRRRRAGRPITRWAMHRRLRSAAASARGTTWWPR